MTNTVGNVRIARIGAAVSFTLAALLGVLASRLPRRGARIALTAIETVLAVGLLATAREALGNPLAAVLWSAAAATDAAVLVGLARRDQVSAWPSA